MSECDSVCVVCIHKQTEINMIHYCILSGLIHISGPPCSDGKLQIFLQNNKFQPCRSLGSHYLEILNAVPLFSSQRKQGIPQLPFLLETWVLSNSKVTTSECCLVCAPLAPYFGAITEKVVFFIWVVSLLYQTVFLFFPLSFNSPIFMQLESLKCHQSKMVNQERLHQRGLIE